MARVSKTARVEQVLRDNPQLRRADPRISELIDAEALLRRAQRAAKGSPVLATTAAGNAKRSPALVALEHAEKSVRRLRADLGVDRVGVKRNEARGAKVKRSPEAARLIELHGETYRADAALISGLSLGLAAHGVEAEDLAEGEQGAFAEDLAAEGPEALQAVRDRIK